MSSAMRNLIAVVFLILLLALPVRVAGNEPVLDSIGKEFPVQKSDPDTGRQKVKKVKEEYPCPPHVPDYVCDIIKYFKPLPFTLEEEKQVRINPAVRRKVKTGLYTNVKDYSSYIEEASQRFGVPVPVIVGVINIESGGNPKAKNPKSSAKGLMQTTDGTFSLARKNLERDFGITIRNPLKAKDSILAGTWYLSYVYDWAAQRHPELKKGKHRLGNWERAFLNYYLGPGHEKYLVGRLVRYPNGHVEHLDKAEKYVAKVMTFAEAASG